MNFEILTTQKLICDGQSGLSLQKKREIWNWYLNQWKKCQKGELKNLMLKWKPHNSEIFLEIRTLTNTQFLCFSPFVIYLLIPIWQNERIKALKIQMLSLNNILTQLLNNFENSIHFDQRFENLIYLINFISFLLVLIFFFQFLKQIFTSEKCKKMILFQILI